MSILLVCLGVALVAGIVTWWMARTWWRTDAGAPHLTTGTIESKVRRHVRLARWLRAHVNAEMATGSLLVAVAIVAIVGGGLFGIVLAMVRSHRGFASFDTSAARFGAHHATHTSTQVLRTVTQAGGAYVIVPLAVVVGIIEARRRRSWATAAFLVVVVGGQYLLADVIKAIVDRGRPNLLRLTGFSGPSFPSGHATAAAATFAAFALLLGRGRSPRAKALLAALAVGAAVLISATRVMLGVHWLTDVVAGLLLGWTWFVISSIAFGGRRLRFGAPLATAERVTNEVTPTDDRPPAQPRAVVRSGGRPA
jgi:membrane-associated phospholipid phosphatase